MAATASLNSLPRLPEPSSSLNGHAPPSAALEAVGARPRRAQRRPTKQASYELCNHAKAYLEGGQFACGYDFLYNLLAAGSSISTPAQPYIGFIAPPAYIALAASLIAYPKITTKTKSREARNGSNAALRYLRCIHTTIDGPAYPIIRKALGFSEENSRRRAPAHRSAAASLSPEPGGDVERIAGEAANAESLWTRAEDFWHVVGWAFNCSRSRKKRWARWKPWLGMMLDFLEADWDFCVRRSNDDESRSEAILQESLLWHYIVGNSRSANRGARRRIVKAILATATPESLKEYPEIWDKETERPQRKKKDDRQLGKVDFETGDMADYDSDTEMRDATADQGDGDDSDNSTDTTDDDGTIHNLHDAIERLGGTGAVELRQRLIALLAQVAANLPTEFTSLSDFFDNILEDFIQLPTITFHALLSTLRLPGLFQVAFCANLLLPLVSGTIPNYFHHEPTQQHFEATLLMLKGTNQSHATNAKISLLLEQMLMYMMNEDALTPTDVLRAAMEAGIQARHGVYGTGKGKRGNAEEEKQAKVLKEACSERMLGLLDLLEMAAGKSAQPLEQDKSGLAFLSFGSVSSLSPPPDSDTEEDG
ncbi:hypothetical protein CC86DRAFT_452836 [Ophiobolus disseminans]|uniref:Uncharacterized protein n=1 Tax=Ophiobolus disseminans TaxID=1469910 RepID=A0A6A7ACG1_9PLEO|nr:hypothetical protein CC86DRAFT_452836 [Ophiobolus disseminans]